MGFYFCMLQCSKLFVLGCIENIIFLVQYYMFRKSPKECSCEVVRRTGIWEREDQDGDSRGGPQVVCLDCGVKFNFIWDQWNELPASSKTE